MELKVQRLHPDAKLPEFAHPDDAGMDVFAYEETIVPAGARAAVPTGLAMAIPDGYVGLFWDKSGLASNHGITVLGGVIDAGYRGELKVAVLNTGDAVHVFARGDKVTQMLIQQVEHPSLVEAGELPQTERGVGGFGSTGK